MTRLMTILAAALFALPVAAAELGDDGLHKTDWMRETFKDLREDLEDANAEGKRLMVMVEQRGCIYCTKMHEEVFPALRLPISSARISLSCSSTCMAISKSSILTVNH